MSSTTLSPEDVKKKLDDAKPEERGALLAQMARDAGYKDQVNVTFSKEEETRLIDGLLGETRKLIDQKAREVEEKYQIPANEARALVEDEASRSAKERLLRNQKLSIIGKRLGTTLRVNGIGSDAYKLAAEEEATFLKKHYSAERAERAMSLADDSSGGALAPEMFEAEVYHNIQQTALGRRYCEVKEIPRGQEIKKWPKITSDLDAEVKPEGSAGNESDIDTTTFSLDPKAIISLSGPISIDLLEASAINIVDHLISRASFVFAKKEDRYLFNGDGGTNWNGLLADVPNGQVITMDTAEDIGDITPDHLIRMEYALEDHYIPDPEDVTGSRVTTGEAMYWFHRAAYEQLKLSKTGTGQYNFAIEDMMKNKRINGNRFRRVPYLESAPAAATRFGLFGNLKYTWIGVRPGIQVEVATQGTVGNTNLFKTGQKAIRFLEFWDYALVDNGSLSALKTGAAS